MPHNTHYGRVKGSLAWATLKSFVASPHLSRHLYCSYAHNASHFICRHIRVRALSTATGDASLHHKVVACRSRSRSQSIAKTSSTYSYSDAKQPQHHFQLIRFNSRLITLISAEAYHHHAQIKLCKRAVCVCKAYI